MSKSLLQMFQNKYSVFGKCLNCGKKQQIKIPRGILVSDFLEDQDGTCLNCGCNSLVVKSLDTEKAADGLDNQEQIMEEENYPNYNWWEERPKRKKKKRDNGTKEEEEYSDPYEQDAYDDEDDRKW